MICLRYFLFIFYTEGSLGQVMEDLELNFSLEEFWMKLGRIRHLNYKLKEALNKI